MEFVKGSSSRYVAGTLRPGEWFKWQGSYGAFSVSLRDKESVIRYIHDQNTHHADGSIWRCAEESQERTETAPAKAGAGRAAPHSDRV